MKATPIFICWNLWKNRCASKYGGKQSSTTRVKFFISKELHMLIITTYPSIKWPNNWNEFISLVENCQHDIKVSGSALENPGRIGAGGLLRDHKGKLIYAFATPLGVGSNNQAEVMAAAFGMNWYI
uniref:Putative ovule protein n=1 Tax=Solanum chacoense TaxID=4108 RepID=A0A0V0GLZ2_SOLCH